MALTDIITKIKDDANAESMRIESAAQEEAQRILEGAKEKADGILAAGKDSAETLRKETHDRAMAAASYQARFATQGFHASLLERTFELVEKKLADLPKGAYHDFIVKRAKALPEKEGALTVAKERKEETLAALKEAGVDTAGAKDAALLGGFVLETKTAEYDHSLKEVARQARDTFSGEAAQALFN